MNPSWGFDSIELETTYYYTEVHSFLSFTWYYWIFIGMLSSVVSVLTKLTIKDI